MEQTHKVFACNSYIIILQAGHTVITYKSCMWKASRDIFCLNKLLCKREFGSFVKTFLAVKETWHMRKSCKIVLERTPDLEKLLSDK